MVEAIKTESNKERKLRERAERDARNAQQKQANVVIGSVNPGALLGKPAIPAGVTPSAPAEVKAEPAKTGEAKAEVKVEPEAKAEVKVEPEAPAKTAEKPTPLEMAVAAMPENTPEEKVHKAEALATLSKLMAFTKASAEKSKFASLDRDLREKEAGLDITAEMVGTKLNLEAYIKALETKHSISLAGRKLIVAFPNGKPMDLTNVPIGPRASSSGGKGGGSGKVGTKTFTDPQGVKTDYISILYTTPDGRTETYDSLNAFAKAKEFKYAGRASATAAILDPWKIDKDTSGNYPKFPYQHSIVVDEKKVLQIKRIDRK